jgi:hypothetical protein
LFFFLHSGVALQQSKAWESEREGWLAVHVQGGMGTMTMDRFRDVSGIDCVRFADLLKGDLQCIFDDGCGKSNVVYGY